MNGEAAPQETPVAAGSVVDASTLLAKCIQLDSEKKAAQKVLDDIDTELTLVKEQVKNLFIEMGVRSMKSSGKNVYIAKQIWAGIEKEVDKKEVVSAMMALDMDDYISFGTQKLSSYVREVIQQNSNLIDSNGEVIATPEEIAAVLPEPFNKMIRVTEKIDIRIRK